MVSPPYAAVLSPARTCTECVPGDNARLALIELPKSWTWELAEST